MAADLLVDLEALGDWMDDQGLPRGPIEAARPLNGGTQNLLLRFERGGAAYVLRRPPRHLRPTSNANLMREARILGALTGQGVPAPALVAACPDQSVMGAAFFLMEPVVGFNATTTLPDLHGGDAAVRRRMGLSAVEAIAAVGALDHEGLGLGDFGRPDGFLERQVPRWLGELASYAALEGYRPSDFPDVDAIARWLEQRRPASYVPGILHGDFHAANLIFRLDGPEVAAIVDWEMATIGDPLLDLGWLLATWPVESGRGGALITGPLAGAGGLASRRELVEHYARHSTRDLDAVAWYAVLACFKLGIVLEGTHARACAGKADPGVGDLLHRVACSLVEQAHQFMTEGVD